MINDTWDLPKASALWNTPLVRGLLDNWQISGLSTFASGAPVNVTFTTTDGADITGGGDNSRFAGGAGAGSTPAGNGVPVLVADPKISNPGLLQWFNTAAFARPNRGNPGNSPKDVVRGPGVNNSDVTLFKNFRWAALGACSFAGRSITFSTIHSSRRSTPSRDSIRQGTR